MVESNVSISVADYFIKTYQFPIKHTGLPCLEVKHSTKKIYLPMEVCTIVSGQRYSQRLTKKQSIVMREASMVRPNDKQEHIKKVNSD